MNQSRASLEKRTLLSTLSRDFPFDHFFFSPCHQPWQQPFFALLTFVELWVA